MVGIEHRPSDLQMRCGMAAVLVLLVLAVFWPSVRYGFVRFDDPLFVSNNEHVITGLSASNVRWAFTSVHQQWWLPILWISYMLDAEFQGPAPAGFHRTNILLHAANAALLFWVLAGLTGSRWRSWFVAALFALHPLRVESVAWITERKDVLSGLFFLLALLAYLHHVRRPSGVCRGAVFAAFLVGLMSKATVIALPILLLLLDYWPLRRAGDPLDRNHAAAWLALLREKIPLFALAILFGIINLHTHVSGSGSGSAISLSTRLGLIAPNYWTYLGKIFWPTHLSPLYPERDLVNWTASGMAVLGLLVATWLLLRLRKSAPYAIVGWLWFLAALFPVLRGVRMGLAAYTDRFTYLPAIGLAIAAVWAVGEWTLSRPPRRIFAIAAGGTALAACVALTRLYLPVWTNSATLFTHLLAFAPDHAMATLGYGRLLMDQGKPAEALPYLDKAARLNPAEPVAAAAYVEALLALDRNDDALAAAHSALAKCGEADPGLNMLAARADLNTRQASDALPHLDRAVAGQPSNPGWQVERVRALFEAGRPDDALRNIQQLRAQGFSRFTDFDSLIPHFGGLWLDGERLHAWHFFRNNLDRLPDDVALRHYAAWLLATDPRPPAPATEAVRLAQEAIALNAQPDSRLLDTLAAAWAANGQFAEAQRQAEQALDLARRANDSSLVAEISRHLETYRRQQPWRESVKDRPEDPP